MSEQKDFNLLMDRKRKRNSELAKKLNLNESGYYWVKFKGDEDEGEPDDKHYSLAYFEKTGSMGQTEMTFSYAGSEYGLERIKRVHSYVERPKD